MNDLDHLRELNRHYVRSVQESDRAWFEEHLAPDFVNHNPDCTVSDRAAFLAFISKPCAVSGLRPEDVRIQRLGDVAIIRAATAYVKPDGGAGAGRYTDVWERRDGRWLCVCADVTRK
jgi:ketosteroid isomerase-like protein